jgi:hypothetical protein
VTVALILLSLAALCLGVFGWLWLAMGFRRGGWRGGLGMAALQLSGLCLLWGLLHGAPMVGLYKAVLPVLAVPDLVQLAGFRGFLAEVMWPALPWAAGVLALALAWRDTRPWAPGLAAAALMVGALVLGEGVSQRFMCAGAAEAGLIGLQRIPFAESLSRNGPAGYHALARDSGGRAWGWSYRAMAWYALPVAGPSAFGLAPFDCPN